MGGTTPGERVALVTEAGRGLGRLIALELARHGVTVLVNHFGGGTSEVPPGDVSLASATAWEIHEAGGRAVASAHNTSSPDGAQLLLQDALADWGRLDIVVAASADPRRLSETPADERRVAAANLSTVFHLLTGAWPAFFQQRYGRFVAVTANAGDAEPSAINAALAGGLAGMMGALAGEGAEHDIKVNWVHVSDSVPSGAEEALPDMSVEGRTSILVAHLASPRCDTNGVLFEVDEASTSKAALPRTPAPLRN